MLITNEYGSVDFDWGDHKKIMLGLSAGTDSALLLWMSLMLLRVKPEATLQVFTGVQPQSGAWKSEAASNLYKKMIAEFTDRHFQLREHQIMVHPRIGAIGSMQQEMHRRGDYDLRIYGQTSNPPYDEMEHNGMINMRVPYRDKQIIKKEFMSSPDDLPKEEDWPDLPESVVEFIPEWGIYNKFDEETPIYMPFINVDKRWVAQAFKDFDIMRFFNDTYSCERIRDTIDLIDSREPCRGQDCWWCKEKHWAFKMYDGEYKEQ